MMDSLASRDVGFRCALLLAVTTALAGCFEDQSGSQRDAVALAAEQSVSENRAPEIAGVPSAVVESGQTYSFAPKADDADQDFLEFQVTNKPDWAQFSNETGLLTGTPQDTDVGETDEITIAVTDGRDDRSVGPFRVKVTQRGSGTSASNTPPVISGTASSSVQVGSSYSFVPTASDANGDKLAFLVSNRPSWVSFNTKTGALTGTPAAANAGTYANIVISVSDGKVTTSLPAFSVQVNNGSNRAPTITGSPSASVQVAQAYSFAPVAADVDGDTLSYTIKNKPAWATFTTANGRLTGTPTAANVGSYSNVVISVSDSKVTTSLTPFSIQVVALTNRSPVISGTAGTSATVGSAYSFTPSASDPDNDALGFTIQNRPAWAAFSTTTGALTGTPTAAGSFGNIVISASDGKATTSLAAFAIVVSASVNDASATTAVKASGSAALAWVAPTENVDGSALGNLAGFRIVYGTSAEALNQTIDLADPAVDSYTVGNLTPATWYFAVKAYNAVGAESALSGVASKTIQ